MAFCNQCGEPVGDDWQFCRSCGRRLTLEGPGSLTPDQQAGAGRKWVIPTFVGAVAVLLFAGWVWQARPFDTPATTTTAQVLAVPESTTTTSTTSTTIAETTTTTRAQTFADVFAATGGGVVRVDVVSCDGGGIGTGFLVADSLVVTAAHVVDQAITIGVTSGDTTTVAEVVGIDELSDIALVRLENPLAGYMFEFAAESPPVGSSIVVLGYPLGESLSLSQGTISGIDRELDGYGTTRLIQTDAAVNFGNSGGPLLDVAGEVVGVVTSKYVEAEGLAYAIPGLVAANRTEEWSSRTAASPAADCDLEFATGPEGDTSIVSIAGVDISEVEDTFVAYFGGINTGDFFGAWIQLSPRIRDRQTLDEFTEGTLSSYDFDIVANDFIWVDPYTRMVWITFVSLQSTDIGPRGEACTLWSLDYTLIWLDQDWYIDRAAGHNGGAASAPCG